jgi:hypothetical protein
MASLITNATRGKDFSLPPHVIESTSYRYLPQIAPLSTVITRQVRGIATHWFVTDIGTTLLGRCSSHYRFTIKPNSYEFRSFIFLFHNISFLLNENVFAVQSYIAPPS